MRLADRAVGEACAELGHHGVLLWKLARVCPLLLYQPLPLMMEAAGRTKQLLEVIFPQATSRGTLEPKWLKCIRILLYIL